MDQARISQRLRPFLEESSLSGEQLSQISIYIDLLLRWNARMNLTAVRDEENIVTRHFGESLFAARITGRDFPAGSRLLDIGSGAGFPGLPIKIFAPHLHVTLIESNHKKATFLREVVRALRLDNVIVVAQRAEDLPASASELVTLRAVERFKSVLPIAARLVAPKGRLVLLIGRDHVQTASGLSNFRWDSAQPLPNSTSRIVLIGNKNPESSQ